MDFPIQPPKEALNHKHPLTTVHQSSYFSANSLSPPPPKPSRPYTTVKHLSIIRWTLIKQVTISPTMEFIMPPWMEILLKCHHWRSSVLVSKYSSYSCYSLTVIVKKERNSTRTKGTLSCSWNSCAHSEQRFNYFKTTLEVRTVS